MTRTTAAVLAGIAAAARLAFGVAAIAQGLDGRQTVHAALARERVVGSPHMTPSAIAARAKDAGLRRSP